jgi:hypothetical protein
MKKIAVAVAIHSKFVLIRYIQFPDSLRDKCTIIEGPKNQSLTELISVNYPAVFNGTGTYTYTPGCAKERDNDILVAEKSDPRAFIAALGMLIRMANWKHGLTEEPELTLVPKGFFVLS